MVPGQPNTSPGGDPADFFAIYEIKPRPGGTGAILRFLPWSGLGDTYWVITVDRKVFKIVFIAEDQITAGQPLEFLLPFRSHASSTHGVTVFSNGHWPDVADMDPFSQHDAYFEERSVDRLFQFDAVIEVLAAYGDNEQLSAWSLSGLRRFANLRTVPNRRNVGELDVLIENDSGTYTVALCLGDYIVAQGSRVGNGVVVLAEQNSSGVSGSVTLAYSAEIALGACVLQARWCEQYQLHISTAALSFPRAAELTITDRGYDNKVSMRYGPLANGTYNWLIRAVSDTGIASTNVASGTLTVSGFPEPCGEISLNTPSGRTLADTRIQFAASATEGATYRAYDSELDEPTNREVIVETAAAGSGTIILQLPELVASGPGFRNVLVRAVSGGVEDRYFRKIRIEYDAGGNVVVPVPNVPVAKFVRVSSLTITVGYAYKPAEAKATANRIKAYLLNESGATVTTATALISGSGAIRTGSLNLTALTPAHYTVVLTALTSGDAESAESNVVGPEWLSAAAPAEPAAVEVVEV